MTSIMRPVLYLSTLLVIFLVYNQPTTAYKTVYDNLDLDDILHNNRLYNRYFQCLANTAKCTPDGKVLKDTLPDALATACSKCTEKQKQGAEKVIKFLLKYKSADFEILEKLYDPNATYRHKYEEEAKKLGIHVD